MVQLQQHRLCHVLLVLLSVLPRMIHATITVASTGHRFRSRPDHLLGTHWTEGYQYMARMTVLDGSPNLCPTSAQTHQNWTLPVTPPDGLPIALLVKGDSCSDVSQAQMALKYVYPQNVVKYLIIYSTGLMQEEQEAAALRGHPIIIPTDIDEESSMQTYGDGHDLHIGVLHVSHLTGTELLQVIHTSSSETMQYYGGPRVLLDGSSENPNALFTNTLFWLGMALVLGGCLCSFFLSLRMQLQNEHLNNNGNPSGRPERRRLTLEQVNELLPEMEFHADECCGIEEECSICLDAILSSDDSCGVGSNLVRKLPCQHVFHSECITKWLTERSSTCPLCKHDFLPEEEEEEDSDDDEEEESLESSVEEPPPPSLLSRLATRFFPSSSNSTNAIVDVDQTPLLQDQDDDEHHSLIQEDQIVEEEEEEESSQQHEEAAANPTLLTGDEQV